MTPNFSSHVLTPVSSVDILALLSTQKENHIHLNEFVKSKDIKPAMVFLPQTIKAIDAEFSMREDLLLDCINFLDAIKIYSLSVYGDSESYLNSIKHFVVENRTVTRIEKTLARESVDAYLFDKKDNAHNFLDDNKLLLAIYVYSLINFILYSET